MPTGSRILFVTTLLVALALAGAAGAAERTAAFAHADPGVRAGAMGGAFTALGEQPIALYWNPAGLYFQDRRYLEASYSSLYGLGLAKRTFLTVGFKRQIELPAFDGNRVVVNKDSETGAAYAVGMESLSLDLEENGYSEVAVSGAAAWGYGGRFVLGISARALFVSSDLEDVSANGYDFGLGVIWRMSDRERVAIAAPHLISRVFWSFDSTERLPFSVTAGWARYWNPNLVTTADLEFREGEDSPYRLAAGAEWWVFPTRLTLRAGYRYLQGGVENVGAPTFGAGVKFGPMVVDYAFRMEPGDLNDTHRIGLVTGF